MTITTKAARVFGALIGVAFSTHASSNVPKIVRVPLITAELPGNPRVGRVEVKDLP